METTPIQYRTEVPPTDQLVHLYTDAGWGAYLKDVEKLASAYRHSQDVITAWDGELLVGAIRTVGDKHTILYVQDILVLKSHKRRGIGKMLLSKLLAEYTQVRQIVLLTDDTPETRGFYEAVGFKSCDDGKLVCFAKLQSTGA